MTARSTVDCPDGKVRTFHHNKTTARRGYVYVSSRRVYGVIHGAGATNPRKVRSAGASR